MTTGKKDHMPFLEGFNGLHSRISIRCLGVVIIRHALDSRHIFKTVLHPFKGFQDLFHIFYGDASKVAAKDGCKNVLLIMGAKNFQIGHLADHMLRAIDIKDKVSLFDPGSLFKFFFGAEEKDTACRAGCKLTIRFIVIIQDQHILCRLMGKNLSLGVDVVFHVAVPFKMVRRDIDDTGNLRMEGRHSLELET